jgi:hypothetical protein
MVPFEPRLHRPLSARERAAMDQAFRDEMAGLCPR